MEHGWPRANIEEEPRQARATLVQDIEHGAGPNQFSLEVVVASIGSQFESFAHCDDTTALSAGLEPVEAVLGAAACGLTTVTSSQRRV